MMASVWRMTMLILGLGLSMCSSFIVPPALRHRRSTIKISMQRTAGTKLVDNPTVSYVGEDRRALHPTTTAQPSSDKQRSVIATTSIATFVGSAGPAHADSLSEGFAQGVGTLNGPGLLAIPIVLGFLVATAVAVFIYSFSQPREFDE